MGSHGPTKGSLAFLNYPAQLMFKSTKEEGLRENFNISDCCNSANGSNDNEDGGSSNRKMRRKAILLLHQNMVYSSSLVDIERDYLSIDKRYPRLFISPEFSKVVANWPKENLKLSIRTPVRYLP